MVHFENSYQFGKQKENDVLPIIKEYFNRDIKASTNKWAKWDFTDETANYELKSRTNYLDKYPDTMITANKITDVRDKKTIFLFNFTDCIAYIEYTEDGFKDYTTKEFSRAKIKEDEKKHIYIPVEDLTIIKKY
jgi:hypothetical protein